jgi:hypothetical protein
MSGAQQPAAGMQRIPIPLESYQSPSPPLNSKRLINFYAEAEADNSRVASALIATPGLSPFGVEFGAGPVVALNTDRPGIIYAVSGTHFYRATFPFGGTSWTIEDLGVVAAPVGADYPWNLMTTIAVGVNGAVVCIPPNAYTCTNDVGAPLNQIGGDFPGASSVAYLDGYFVFTSANIDARFFCSLLLDPTNYDALDFAYADAVPNILRRVMTLRDELWFIGNTGIEIWYNAGSSGLETTPSTSFFPFRRQSGGFISHGANSMKTTASIDGSIFWIGETGTVYRSNGYRAERISTHAIEALIREQGTATVVCSLTYIQDGHSFYAVTFGTLTLVYDCATKVWHERSSGPNAAWLPLSAAAYGEVPIFGASNSGKLLTTVPFLDTDDGILQQRRVVLPPLWGGTHRAFCARLEVEMEVGAARNPPQLGVSWSDDGGFTFGPQRLMTVGSDGNYRRRVYTTRLGSFRQRTFQLDCTGHTAIYAVDADIQVPGASNGLTA